MDKRDKGYTLYKKGLSCTEISKKLDVSINTVKSWRKRYWTQGADAPAKRTLHPEDAPAAPDPETRPKQGAPPGNVNAVGAGAPKGNRNAVKHGGWSELMFRSWTEEHRQLLDACDEDVDAEELLINELKLLTAREGYLLERISHYSKEGAYVQTQTTSKRSRNFKRLDGDTEKEKNDLQAYVDAIDAKVAAGERLPGNETLTNSTLEASYLIIERLNKLLTDVQRQKAQCIKQLAELRNMSGGGKSELDLTPGYSTGGFSISVTDYWFNGGPGYFHYGTHHTSHVFEAQIGYDFGPLAVNWYTNFAGADGVNKDGDRAYSSYISLAAPFKLAGLDWTAEIGATPWANDFYNVSADPECSGSDGFAVCDISLGVSKEIKITDSFSVPAFAKVTVNPRTEGAYFVFGLSF